MQVHLKALGCRLNEAELETWARKFRDRGFTVTTNPERADLVVVNTCAVTDEAVRKSRRLLRRAHRDNPRAKLVVTGCYSSINKEESSTIPGVDLIVDNARKDALPQIVVDTLDLHASPGAATEPGENLLFARGRQRAFIKVQDGCRYRCTYCIVTVARGEERSRPVTEVVDEITRLAAEGIRAVVLAGAGAHHLHAPLAVLGALPRESHLAPHQLHELPVLVAVATAQPAGPIVFPCQLFQDLAQLPAGLLGRASAV